MVKATRRGTHRAQTLDGAHLRSIRTTLGELIAAAYDTLGNRLDVAQVLTSRELTRAAHARIVLQ